MYRKITQVRDINEIEKQIQQAANGVLCIHLDNEKLMQFACNFIYLDKNVFAFLDKTDEDFEHVKYGSAGSFTIFKNEKVTSKSKDVTYKLFYITISGEIKNIDDPKLAEQVKELYRLKYSPSISPDDYILSENLNPVILDTREIKSLIEEGI
jgi:hypothetical protein